MDNGFLASLVSVLGKPYFDGIELVRVLKLLPDLAECFDAPLGGPDGLTLEQHALDALQTFTRSFERNQLALLPPASFKLLLAIHDLGKPQAVAEGRLDRQHAHTLRKIDGALSGLEWPEKDCARIKTLINGDPIGACLNKKYLLPPAQAAVAIRGASTALGVDVHDYWAALLVYFQCDAAAYPSVREKVFKTDRHGAPRFEAGSAHFAFRDPDEALRFERLRSTIFRA